MKSRIVNELKWLEEELQKDNPIIASVERKEKSIFVDVIVSYKEDTFNIFPLEFVLSSDFPFTCPTILTSRIYHPFVYLHKRIDNITGTLVDRGQIFFNIDWNPSSSLVQEIKSIIPKLELKKKIKGESGWGNLSAIWEFIEDPEKFKQTLIEKLDTYRIFPPK